MPSNGGMAVKVEPESMEKEAVVAYFEILSQNLLGEIEENRGECQDSRSQPLHFDVLKALSVISET
jgi:hypothetical protein